MNELGTKLIWVGLQVTLVSLVGAGLYGLAARRGPGAGSALATVALGLCLALPVLALCPLPRCWTWVAPPPEPVAPAPTAPAGPEPGGSSGAVPAASPTLAAAPAAGQSGGLDLPPGWLRRTWRHFRQVTTRPPASPGYWPGAAAGGFLAGVTFGLLRLLLGLWAVHGCCRRGRPINDAALRQLVESLGAEMGCTCPVGLREIDELAGPATVGWRRPVLLLPADWRAWSGPELRAALAHELAHVCRRDYLTGLLARLSVVLHFYHPLVHWLAGRLRLQQELAADAQGARHVGGRIPYLRSLARLALRQDGRPPRWPARALLSSRGTLMRRIDMLRERKDPAGRALPRGSRLLLTGLLVAAAFGASALRGPARPADPAASGEAGPESQAGGEPADLSRTPEREPFNLAYASPDARGVCCFRPAAVFGRPEMKRYAEFLDASIDQLFKQFGFKEELKLSVAAVEEVVGEIVLRTDGSRKDHQTSLAISLTMVRTARDFDWKERLKPLAAKVTEVRHAGKVYFKVPPEALGMLGAIMGAGPEMCVHFPDSQTLVVHNEETMRRVLAANNGSGPERPWSADWKQVERGVLAVAFDNRDKSWLTERTAPREAGEEWFYSLFESCESVVLGADGTAKRFGGQALVRCGKEGGAAKVAETIEEQLVQGRADLEAARQRQPAKEGQEVLFTHLEDLLKKCRVRRQGTSVRVASEVDGDLWRLLGTAFNAEMSLKDK